MNEIYSVRVCLFNGMDLYAVQDVSYRQALEEQVRIRDTMNSKCYTVIGKVDVNPRGILAV